MSVYNYLLLFQGTMIVVCVVFNIIISVQKENSLSKLMLCISFLSIIQNTGYFMEMLSKDLRDAMTALKVEYIGAAFLSTYLFFFAFKYCKVKKPKGIIACLLAWDTLVLILVWTSANQTLYYSDVDFVYDGLFPHLVLTKGILYYVNMLILLFQIICGIVIASIAAYKERDVRLKNSRYMFCLTMIVPFILYLLQVAGVTHTFDPTPSGVALGNLIFVIGVISQHLFDVADVAYSNIVHNLNEALIIMDSVFGYVDANHEALKLFPELEKYSVGDSMDNFCLAPYFSDRQQDELAMSGKTYYVSVTEIMEKDVHVGYTVMLMDVTEERDNLHKMEQMKVEAENANNAKSTFLAKMSHEIRTPINSIMGMNEMIARECGEKKILKYSEYIKSSTDSLLSIVNEILDSSKIESGKMELVLGNYALSSMLNDLYNMMIVKARENSLKLIFNVDNILPSEYYGDNLRISQVLINLLNNAIKYTPKGSVTLNVTGRVEGDYANLKFEVVDTGVGIKRDNMERLFAAYERIDEERNHFIEGSGLGMNITRDLLELMGSSLSFDSEFGKGSKFYFELKQKVVNSQPIGNFEDRNEKEEEIKSDIIPFIAPNARILVVDDNDVNRKVFCSLLKKMMIVVDEANGGIHCLERLMEHKYNMIFMDHMMPGMDGIETLREIKKRKLCEGVPIIMLSANAVKGMKEQFLEAGFDDFLPKPIIPSKLDKMVLKYLPRNLVRMGDVGKNSYRTNIIPEIDGIDLEYVSYYVDDETVLQRNIFDFYKYLDSVKGDIAGITQRMSDVKSADDYATLMEVLCEKAKQVGALGLSTLCRYMKEACATENSSRITALNDLLVQEIEKICVSLEKVFPGNEKKISGKDEIITYLDMLIMSLKNRDVDGADEVMKRLRDIKYDEEVQRYVNSLDNDVLVLDVDSAEKAVISIKEILMTENN